MEFFFLSVRQVLLFFNMEASSFPCWKRKKGSFGIFSNSNRVIGDYIKTDYMKRSFEILINVPVPFFFNKMTTSSSFFGIFRIVFRKLYHWKIFLKSFRFVCNFSSFKIQRPIVPFLVGMKEKRKVLRIFDISNCIIMETLLKTVSKRFWNF